MLTNTPMKRFYLATPTKYEDQIIEDLGALGSTQLIPDYTIKGFKKVDTVERCERYIKLQQRMRIVLAALPPEQVPKRSFVLSLKASFGRPVQRKTICEADLEEIESYVSSTETTLDEKLGGLEKLRSEANGMRTLEESLLILQKHGLKANDLGDFEHVFVKAGFMNKAFSLRFQRYAEGTSVRYAKWPEKREEDFIVLLGLNQDKPRMEETLKLLNFAELTLPQSINPDPAQALEQNKCSMTEIEKHIRDLEEEIRAVGKEFQNRAGGYESVVRRALVVEEARSTFSRTNSVSLAHGWIPAEQEEPLKKAAETSTSGAVFLRFEEPLPDDQPPARMRNTGVLASFELLTKLRGTPQYRELDPTPIVTVLFTIMYGMMFGDLGQGTVLLAIGLVFSRLQRDFLQIPARAIRKLGGILATCGVSAVFFGALYGEFFLYEAFPPLFVNPIQGQMTMIVIALLFGVVQLTLGIVLKIVNLLRMRATVQAAFGGIRLVYYVTGVALAVQYATRMSFAVFTENLWLTVVAIGSLLLLFLSPTIENILTHEFRFGQSMMMGASEFIETFLSYLTNSISYVRLAAFAIAHSALGLSAVILATTIGHLPGYIAMNLLAMTIEALGVLIQCMRLTYYEFFTKFYSNGGVAYRPFSLPKVYASIK